MRDLPARPNLDQLRHHAKDLLRAAKGGDDEARERILAVSDRLILASAQLAVAREHGFASWPKLKTEVERREILNSRDLARLTNVLREEPALATAKMEHWCDHPKGAEPLGYIAMLRFDSRRLGLPRDLPGTGAVARALLDAGAPVDGIPGAPETPLITAASYGDAEVASVLIGAGADLEATAAPNAGGVPGGTALRHAAVFGMTEVVDVLVALGARIHGIEEAAAAGDATGWLTAEAPLEARIRALVMAADHERLDVVDQLIAAGTPVDAADAKWGRQALRTAAENGRAASVRRLLAHGADPNLRDPEHGRTPLEWCRQHRAADDSPGYEQVERMLQPLTSPGPAHDPDHARNAYGSARSAADIFDLLTRQSDSPRMHGIVGRLRFDIVAAGTWTVTFDGATTTVRAGKRGKADCTVELSEDVFLELVQGKRNPETAFRQGLLKVTGDIRLAQRAVQIFT